MGRCYPGIAELRAEVAITDATSLNCEHGKTASAQPSGPWRIA
jgi:hypothetical protein